MVSSFFVVYLELFLQLQCMPSPSLESHALFLHLLLLLKHPVSVLHGYVNCLQGVFIFQLGRIVHYSYPCIFLFLVWYKSKV